MQQVRGAVGSAALRCEPRANQSWARVVYLGVSIGQNAKIRLGVPVYQDADHVISVCENTVLAYSVRAPNPQFLDAWTRTMDLLAERFPSGVLVITIIERRVQPPDEVSRTRIRNTVLRHAAQIKAFAYVVEGEGFGAAAVRSALSLISMAARYPFPMKVFGVLEEAVPWMLNRPESGAHRDSATKLIGVAHTLRGELKSSANTG